MRGPGTTIGADGGVAEGDHRGGRGSTPGDVTRPWAIRTGRASERPTRRNDHAIWLLAARIPEPESVEGVHLGIGLVYLLATFLGAAGALEILSIDDGVLAPDNFLHLASGLVALIAGFSARSAVRARATA